MRRTLVRLDYELGFTEAKVEGVNIVNGKKKYHQHQNGEFTIMKRVVSIFLFVIVSSCGQSSQDYSGYSKQAKKTVILFQPLGKFSEATLKFLKDKVENFYAVSIIIEPSKSFPSNAYYEPRNRYRADSTIAWLRLIKPDSVRTIVGLTQFDISTTKGNVKDYGIMGLGFQPGNSCIVSDFRLKKDHPSEALYRDRLFKTVVHEIGHNFGLPHCRDKHCFMADAEGTMNQDNEMDLCSKCRIKLKMHP